MTKPRIILSISGHALATSLTRLLDNMDVELRDAGPIEIKYIKHDLSMIGGKPSKSKSRHQRRKDKGYYS